jgi:hypothetical protein
VKAPALVHTWWFAIAAITVGVSVRLRPAEDVQPSRLEIPQLRSAAASASRASIDSGVAELVGQDPFRLARTPSRARYALTDSASVMTTPIAPHDPRPSMTLKAIAGGPPWHALIDGLPGKSRATLVGSGAVIDKLVVRAIARDSVVVHGPDTTWVLRFARRL